MMLTLDAFLADKELTHLSEKLKATTLEELVAAAADSRPKVLEALKDLGVDGLADRQKIANGLGKALRDGVVDDPKKKQREKAAKKAALDAEGPRVQKFDDEFDLASAVMKGVAKEDPDKVWTTAGEDVYGDKITWTAVTYSLQKNMNEQLKVLGSVGHKDKTPPAQTRCTIVGAGLAGLAVAQALVTESQCTDQVLLEMTFSAGGVWTHQGNSYSRVNSSEPSYRLERNTIPQKKDTLTNHTPCHQIIASMHRLICDYDLSDKLYLNTKCEAVIARKDGKKGWLVEGTNLTTGESWSMHTELAAMCTNRRLGAPRKLMFPDEDKFKGQIARGLNSDAEALDWMHRTIIIGMGAYALEHMRTALEREAPYCTVLCRRRGAVCPQVIDWVNFVRPVQDDFTKAVAGSGTVHSLWAKTYDNASATVPDCWHGKPRLLKPDGHTVSTSDLFFVAHYLKLATTLLGEIERFDEDGVWTKDYEGSEIPDAFMPCGVVIKCVGFEINRSNEKILQRKETRASGLVDENLWVVLEAHLDAGFFSLPFGSSYSAQAAYTAVCIARGFSNPDSMKEMLTTPVNATISHFTASDLFDSLVAIQAVCPELREYLHKYIAQATERFNSALSFKEYLDRNQVMWTEYHEFLYPRTPIINARDKGELPWVFRVLEQLVIDEWDEINAKGLAKKFPPTPIAPPAKNPIGML